MSKINVITKRPGELPRHVNISNTMKNLQNTVEGYIEVVKITEDIIMICDEEGIFDDSELNFYLGGTPIFGPVIFCGVDGEEFADIPITFEEYKNIFKRLFNQDTNYGVSNEDN